MEKVIVINCDPEKAHWIYYGKKIKFMHKKLFSFGKKDGGTKGWEVNVDMDQKILFEKGNWEMVDVQDQALWTNWVKVSVDKISTSLLCTMC